VRPALPPAAGLDPGIAEYVSVLRAHGVETFESCEGSEGHVFPEPTVRFAGQREEGFRALAVALEHGFPVRAVRRYWRVLDGEPSGPDWELSFWPTDPCGSGPRKSRTDADLRQSPQPDARA
jgi:hypothetical protein